MKTLTAKNRARKRVVIVDGYSTGREVVRELLNREVECLHLQSVEQPPAWYTKGFDSTPYDADLGYLGDVDEAIEALSGLKPDAVIAGSEIGVSFAEQIAHGMGLPTNRIELLTARRDKFDMIEAARRHGLHVASQKVVDSVEAAHAWARSHGAWPVVLKPLASAGSDGVSVCHSHDDIDAGFARAFRQKNLAGGVNDQLLMQSFLAGPQFIVNTVSWGGRHYVTDVWSMIVSISGSNVVPGGIHLLDPAAAHAKALMAYTFGVLDALGIENGPAHTELKMTPQGPALIETGARVMGAAMDEPSYAAAGMRTQANVFAGVLAGCDGERDAPFAKGRYRFRRHMTKLLFNFHGDGTVRGTAGLARLRQLPSFNAHYRPLAVGGRVWETADWLACGGIIYLIADDPGQIAGDIETIRQWEKRNQLYDIAPLYAAA